MTREDFLRKLAQADARIALAKTHLDRVLSGLVSNFLIALDAHNEFLKQIHAAPEFDPTILFEIALTLLAGGLGGKVADASRRASSYRKPRSRFSSMLSRTPLSSW